METVCRPCGDSLRSEGSNASLKFLSQKVIQSGDSSTQRYGCMVVTAAPRGPGHWIIPARRVPSVQ
jgi:hypothetical protein